jgi:hypothetical protein
VLGGFRDAEDGGCCGAYWHGQCETVDAGEAVTDSPGEDDVRRPTGGGQYGEPDAGTVDVASPGFAEEHHT